MENAELKKALIAEIDQCENNDLLLEALLLLVGPPPSQYYHSAAQEAETEYKTGNSSPVPKEHWDLLKQEMEEYLAGNATAISWEDFKKELFEDI